MWGYGSLAFHILYYEVLLEYQFFQVHYGRPITRIYVTVTQGNVTLPVKAAKSIFSRRRRISSQLLFLSLFF